MIFKVLYQENAAEIPVREHTKSKYIEAESERKVREILKDQQINIEFIQRLEGAHLAYEQQSPHFQVENA
ncbi:MULTISPECIES: DNA-dependent RNA polymerase subunit epsilon [Gracilibacillus]|uniref:DNA-dependent RNA polymerase subunit epsilon n=1 Tax=Gracilibacillus TaxID=74385 RepID=UPI0008246AFA|nr:MULTISPECIES: DNA-directed RNA polymerase subunit epsilon [Gracilibacillus]